MPNFDAQDISLLLMAIQRYRNIQESKLKDYEYPEADIIKRNERINQLDSLEEKLFDWLNQLEDK